MNSRSTILLASISGAMGILIGAFGAHALPQVLHKLEPDAFQQRADWLETGVKYHMYHAAALLALGLASSEKGRNYSRAAAAWTLGIVLFSGSLYVMTLSGIRVLGAVVPLGGVSLTVGWVLVAVTAGQRVTTE